MAFSRTAALRTCIRGTRPTIARPQFLRQIPRRGYASGGHGAAKAGGDALWAAGAIAVTVPSCWFILSNSPDSSHGHDGHGGHSDSHEKGHEEEAKEESADDAETEEKPDEGAEKEEEEEKSEGSGTGDEKEADTPETSDDESEKPEAKDAGKNTKTHIPDAKGGAKNRLESKAAIKAGELKDDGNTDGPSDKAAASKESGNRYSQSGKQEGLSNTDTKHSYDITNDPTKSKKGEGAPETAKLKGTVDPKRPQPEAL